MLIKICRGMIFFVGLRSLPYIGPHFSDNHLRCQLACRKISAFDIMIHAMTAWGFYCGKMLTMALTTIAKRGLAMNASTKNSSNSGCLRLPDTMATANAMYERMAKAYHGLFSQDGNPSLVLTQGARHLSEAFNQSLLNCWPLSPRDWGKSKARNRQIPIIRCSPMPPPVISKNRKSPPVPKSSAK